MENGSITKEFFEQSTFNNKHFLISFNKFLAILVKEDDLYPDFKMMTKRLLFKIEAFIFGQLEIEARNKNLRKEYDSNLYIYYLYFLSRIVKFYLF